MAPAVTDTPERPLAPLLVSCYSAREMTVAKITLNVVKTLPPGSVVWDRDLKGFGVRRQREAVKYVLKSRIRGRDHWFTLGTHGAPWTPDTARQEAKRMLGEIAAGRNLAEVREQQRSVLTLAEVVDRFLEEHGTKVERRTITEYERLLRRHAVPALGNRPIDAIDRAAIAKLHHSLVNTPRQANLLLSVLSKMMGWAAKRGLFASEANPCRGIDRYKESKRERFLSTAELARLGEVLREAEQDKTLSPYAISAIRLLLLTGARTRRNLDPPVGSCRSGQSAAPATAFKDGPEVDLSNDSCRRNPAIIATREGESLRDCR